MKQLWPAKVWERGDIDERGKQLWFSRPVEERDRARRDCYEADVAEMRAKRDALSVLNEGRHL